ncbi:MAG TPA: PhzF family phenazine biosynthesis protein [Gemmatimonadaceae bacterium]|nr:PhzF family phenazine biosynthesis protein [Gemmatimonadaceae bacterium]
MTYKYHTLDVFTDVAFGGNPLAVLTDARGLTTEQMTALTREFNYSETVFVLPPDDPKNTRRVRIFTPGSELPFAGHPTVGTAFLLAAIGEVDLDGDETRIVLEEGVGPVTVVIRSRNGKPYFTQLSAAKMPERGPTSCDAATVASLLSLSVDDIDSAGAYSIEALSTGVPFLFVPIRDIAALGRAMLNHGVWEKTLKNSWSPEVFLFTELEESIARNGVKTGDGVLQARMFSPAMGIAEDPATGSAAAALGGYLACRSDRKDGTLKYTVYQGVEMGRPSKLEVETDVTQGIVQAVRVGGASILISSGTLHTP